MLVVAAPGPAPAPAGLAAPGPLLVLDLRVSRAAAAAGVLAVPVVADSAARMTALSSWLAMYRGSDGQLAGRGALRHPDGRVECSSGEMDRIVLRLLSCFAGSCGCLKWLWIQAARRQHTAKGKAAGNVARLGDSSRSGGFHKDLSVLWLAVTITIASF